MNYFTFFSSFFFKYDGVALCFIVYEFFFLIFFFFQIWLGFIWYELFYFFFLFFSNLTVWHFASSDINYFTFFSFFSNLTLWHFVSSYMNYLTHMWKTLAWLPHFSKRESLCSWNQFNPATFYRYTWTKPGKWAVMYLSVRGIRFASFLLDFGTVPTVW